MRGKRGFCPAVLVTLFLLSIFSQMVFAGLTSENREIEFEVVDHGDLSGFSKEELYLVVKSEAEWESLWQKHTTLCLPPKPYPRIDFSKEMVICAFMGERPTAGYSISIKKIWDDGEVIQAEVIKSNPPEGVLVAQIRTCPYVFISLETTDKELVLHVTEEDWTNVEHILPEFSMSGFLLVLLLMISTFLIVLKTRLQ